MKFIVFTPGHLEEGGYVATPCAMMMFLQQSWPGWLLSASNPALSQASC